MERYIGFYASRPFWSGAKPDFNSININDSDKFTEIMSEDVFIHETENYKLKLCRDGLILFRLEEIATLLDEYYNNSPKKPLDIGLEIGYLSKYLNYLNCIYLLLESSVLKISKISYFELSEITNRDAFSYSFDNGKFSSCSISDQSYNEKFQQGRFLNCYEICTDLTFEQNLSFDSRMFFRSLIIDEETFNHFTSILDSIINDYNNVKILSDLAKGIHEYKIGNYSTSMVLSWFLIEFYLNDIWIKFLDSVNSDEGETKRINSSRMKYLRDRDFHISVIQNMLELFGIISLDLCKRINRLRKMRNKLVHKDSGITCGSAECVDAFDVIIFLIKQSMDIEILLNKSYSFRGL